MKIRRTSGVAALGAAALLALAPAAHAETPDAGAVTETTEVTYAAASTGDALALTVFGEQTTIGRTLAGLDSSLRASSTGVGLANTSLGEAGVSEAEASGEGVDGSPEEVCAYGLDQVPGLTLEFACSSSLAQVLDGIPTATATGRVGTIRVNPVETVSVTPLGAVVPPVADGVQALLDELKAVTTPISDGTGLRIDDTLDDLFGSLFAGADLVTIKLGTTKSVSTVTDAQVASTCASHGGRIDVLDIPAQADGLDPAPVMSIVIGDASSSVEVDTADGTATPAFNPAIVTVIVPSLGINQPVGPGDTLEIPELPVVGSSSIAVADGTTEVNEAGQTVAKANAVFLDLLNGDAMMGGVELNLAACSSAAGAALTAVPVAPPTPEVPALPRTGGGMPNSLALFGSLGLAAVGLSLLRRNAVAG